MRRSKKTESPTAAGPETKRRTGFSLIEVILAAAIMIILCVGLLTVYSNVVERNRGENLRLQALSVLQKEVEYYRSLKFVPIGSSSELNGGTYTNLRQRTSADGRVFDISVTIDNDPNTPGPQTNTDVPEASCKFKEITITAVPVKAETGWLSNLKTTVTIQRVRSN